ncbi:MAG: hypothetical protein SPL50_02085, partial [Alloprevotella sp.]|nr:hypothetical protein [Alloprevotella sp.]
MDAKKSIEALQFFATGLTEGALVHKLQGQIFKSQGFTKLGEKYINHFNEEMEWVEKLKDYKNIRSIYCEEEIINFISIIQDIINKNGLINLKYINLRIGNIFFIILIYLF